MEIPKFIKGVAKYFIYASSSGETTPTTQADLQELMKNNNTILECLVDGLWQPEKEMKLNQIIRSPNMPPNTVAKVTSAGTTGTTEPEWLETVDATVSDGSVTFTMSSQQTDIKKTTINDLIYPIGSIYMSVNSTSPADLFGGTWDAMPAGRVLLAQGKSQWGTTYAAGSTGGEATHLLTPEEMPRHKHDAVATTTPLTGTYTADRWGSGPGTATGVFSAGTGSGSNCRLDNVASPVKINLNATHLHEITINSEGGDKPHPNMQPYLAVFIWVRTA